MTRQLDLEQLLDIWLDDGPTDTSDAVFDAAVARIYRQRQRPAWRVSQRDSDVKAAIKPLLAVAAVVAVAVASIAIVQIPSGQWFSGTASPSQPPMPSVGPGASIRVVPEGGGRLTPGRWRFPVVIGDVPLSIDADIPTGWFVADRFGLMHGDIGTDMPRGIGVAFLEAETLYRDPCRWDLDGSGRPGQPGEIAVGPSARNLVDALVASPAHAATPPTPITFDGHPGWQLEIQLPGDVAACDRDADGIPRAFPWAPSTEAQGDDNRWRLFIIDVDGDRLIVAMAYYEGTPVERFQAAMAIVDSLVITR